MARGDNKVTTKSTKITVAWPLYEYLRRAIRTGFYGTTFTSAAERAIEKHIEWLIEQKKIDELSKEELANEPQRDSKR